MQYTTLLNSAFNTLSLFISMSKYKFECNTQLTVFYQLRTVDCLSVCQSTNLNAIHNQFRIHKCGISIVYQYVKVQIYAYWDAKLQKNHVISKIFQ